MTLSGSGRRRKGVVGEREVTHLFSDAGFDVRGLEGLGDHIVSRGVAGKLLVFKLEVKRQERLRIHEWMRQCEAETPPGMIPLLVYRRSGEPWRCVLGLDRLLELVA